MATTWLRNAGQTHAGPTAPGAGGASPRRRRRQVAFTLIELLAVVAIIALLAAMLVPSLRRARDLARQAVCAANLRGQGLAWHVYLSDFDLAPPMPKYWQAHAYPTDHYRAFLSAYVHPGIGDQTEASVVFCPANAERQRKLSRGVHYMNAVGSWAGDDPSPYLNLPLWVKARRLPDLPGGGAILYDAVCWRGGWQWQINNHGWDAEGYTRGGNVLFVDGHVEWEGAERWVLRYPYEGTTYPADHFAVRVWGTQDRFGYGPPGARLYAWNSVWRYLVDTDPLTW